MIDWLNCSSINKVLLMNINRIIIILALIMVPYDGLEYYK